MEAVVIDNIPGINARAHIRQNSNQNKLQLKIRGFACGLFLQTLFGGTFSPDMVFLNAYEVLPPIGTSPGRRNVGPGQPRRPLRQLDDRRSRCLTPNHSAGLRRPAYQLVISAQNSSARSQSTSPRTTRVRGTCPCPKVSHLCTTRATGRHSPVYRARRSRRSAQACHARAVLSVR